MHAEPVLEFTAQLHGGQRIESVIGEGAVAHPLVGGDSAAFNEPRDHPGFNLVGQPMHLTRVDRSAIQSRNKRRPSQHRRAACGTARSAGFFGNGPPLMNSKMQLTERSPAANTNAKPSQLIERPKLHAAPSLQPAKKFEEIGLRTSGKGDHYSRNPQPATPAIARFRNPVTDWACSRRRRAAASSTSLSRVSGDAAVQPERYWYREKGKQERYARAGVKLGVRHSDCRCGYHSNSGKPTGVAFSQQQPEGTAIRECTSSDNAWHYKLTEV